MERLLLPCCLAVLLPLQAAPGFSARLPGDRPGTVALDPSAPLLLARERGGHQGGRGGGHRARSGLGSRQFGLDRGNHRPDGGWSRGLAQSDRARRQFNRGIRDLERGGRTSERLRDGIDRIDRDDVRRRFERGERQWERAGRHVRDDWRKARDDWRDVRDDVRDDWRDVRKDLRGDLRDVDRRLDRAADRLRRWDDHWPGWVRPGWALARPWSTGWYGGWARPPWGWWGSRSLAWGLGSLATAAVINEAVDQAIAASRTTIVVPDAGYSLLINSIEPSGEATVRFVALSGDARFEATADCRSGSLNGREPATAAQAQLINAACQVAYGS